MPPLPEVLARSGDIARFAPAVARTHARTHARTRARAVAVFSIKVLGSRIRSEAAAEQPFVYTRDVGKQITLTKPGPSKDVWRLDWSTWISGTTLEWFEHKRRAAIQVQVGDRKNGRRAYPTEEAAITAQQRAIEKKLGEGYQYRDESPAPPTAKPSKAWAKRPSKPAWTTKVTKELAAVRKAIVAAKLEHRSADLESLVRPAIRLKPKTVRSVKGVVTRFGGEPDVPVTFAWPKGLAFVAQFRLDELASFDLENKLPHRGLLSVFANLAAEAHYGEQARVFHHLDVKQLAPMPSPNRDDGGPTKIAIAPPSIRLTLPPPDSSAAGALRLNEDERSRYHDELWLATSGDERDAHHLLGWPGQVNQHGLTKGWELLAQIASDDRFGLEMGDVETLRVHIGEAKRKAAKFDSVRSAIGGE